MVVLLPLPSVPLLEVPVLSEPLLPIPMPSLPSVPLLEVPVLSEPLLPIPIPSLPSVPLVEVPVLSEPLLDDDPALSEPLSVRPMSPSASDVVGVSEPLLVSDSPVVSVEEAEPPVLPRPMGDLELVLWEARDPGELMRTGVGVGVRVGVGVGVSGGAGSP